MPSNSANDAKHGFGRLIDLAIAAPVAIAKHGRPIAVLSAEAFNRWSPAKKSVAAARAGDRSL